jgi:hypothetical protein
MSMKKRVVASIFSLCIFCASTGESADVRSAFRSPYDALLSKVASDSPLFDSPPAVERTLLAEDRGGRAERLAKKIAAARMLLADGQIEAGDEASCFLARLPVGQLIEAGEQWVMLAQARSGGIQVAQANASCAKEGESGGKSKRDNRFDILDNDEFNLFDVLAFPFRLIGFVLELLFNIILFPFKVITSVIF